MNQGMYSSNKDDWSTPQNLFDYLDDEYHFDLDVCADESNYKCTRYFNADDDGLLQPWYGMVWMNPPYGREIIQWMRKAYHESRQSSCQVLCLVPSRTDNFWWHEYVMKSSSICFIRGRLVFSGADSGAPFPSALVYFTSQSEYPILKVLDLKDLPN